jgi:N-acetyl-gamma-glutamyl-phosphate reductase
VIRIGIVGATGYTGVELLRLLAPRRDVELKVVTSRELQGTPVHRLFPNLRGHLQLDFSAPDTPALFDCDAVFFATPHGVAMASAAALLDRDVRVIDLSADFRLRDVQVWEQWYHTTHASPQLLDEAVYGLPEVNREQIRTARLVAVPGCYPTAVQLGFLPLLEQGLVDVAQLIADAKSGVSGAGRKAAVDTLLTEAADSIKAYGVLGHRHLPEIVQGLNRHSADPVNLTFIPHLTPMIRGILATLYAQPKPGISLNAADLQALYEERYRDEPFVDVLPAGEFPATRNVKGANYCQISVSYLENTKRVVVLSAEDNLVKGASGQAIQNMNIMFGLPETAGLEGIALLP